MWLLIISTLLWAKDPNWCSYSPNRLIFPAFFTHMQVSPICREHDICYFTIGKSKYQCDRSFLKLFRETCRSRFNSWAHTLQRNECLMFAEIYHGGLVSGLHRIDRRSYESAQEETRTVLARLNGEALRLKNNEVETKVAYFMAELEARGHKPKSAIELTVQELLKYQDMDIEMLFAYDELQKIEDDS